MRKLIVAVFCLSIAVPAFAGDVTYRKDIRPLFEAKCSACHGGQAPYLGEFKESKEKYKALHQGPRMDTYADLLFFIAWPDTGAIMRRLDDGKNTKDGKPGNMYSHLGDTEGERQKNLKLFKAWIGEDSWVLKRRADITKEELGRIKAKY